MQPSPATVPPADVIIGDPPCTEPTYAAPPTSRASLTARSPHGATSPRRYGVVIQGKSHYHAIYRDKEFDYGAAL